MSESKQREYKRATVAKKLPELMRRVMQLNDESEHPDFVYKVEELIVFGSFVNTDNEKIHDLDIGIKLVPKDKYVHLSSEDLQHISYRRAVEANITDMILQSFWLEEEVLRYLKNKSGIYSFHPADEKNGEGVVISKSKAHVVMVTKGEVTEDAKSILRGGIDARVLAQLRETDV